MLITLLATGCGTAATTPATIAAKDAGADAAGPGPDVAAADATGDTAGSDAAGVDATDVAGGTDAAGTDLTAADADAGPPPEDVAPAPQDTASPGDTATPVDDVATAQDTAAPQDAATPQDTATPLQDAVAPLDTATPPNDVATADAADASPPKPGGLGLQVVTPDSWPIAGAAVTLGAAVTKTDASGVAGFDAVAAGTAVFAVGAPGYATVTVAADIPPGSEAFRTVTLFPLGTAIAVSADATAVVNVNGATLVIAPNSFVDANGVLVTGVVDVAITKPNLGGLWTAPYSFAAPFVAKSAAGTLQKLEPVALVEVSFTAGGKPVSLAKGVLADLRIAVNNSPPPVGTQVPAYWLDKATGQWTQDGVGTIDGDNDGGKYWHAKVGHFTWWMGAVPSALTGCYAVTVTSGGAPLAGAQVWSQAGTASAFDVTGAAGTACVEAPVDGNGHFTVEYPGLAQKGGAGASGPDIPATAFAACGTASATGCVPVTIELVKPNGCLSGVVTKADGTPAANATVVMVDDNGGVPWVVTTGSDGSYCSAAPVGADIDTYASLIGGANTSDDTNVNVAGTCGGTTCAVLDLELSPPGPADGCGGVPDGVTCDDGNACTLGDSCIGGQCYGANVVPCNDGNACTTDACDSKTGVCTSTPIVDTGDGTDCNDGNACTNNEFCTNGVCGGSKPVDCNDNNACTDDSCSPTFGCVVVANTAACDDGNACTVGDVCGGGACSATTLPNGTVCGAGNACVSSGTCQDAWCSGITNLADGTVCDDSMACTVGSTCTAGTCGVVSCDDSNPCTNDGCAKSGVCEHTPNNDVTCSACMGGGTCNNGACPNAALVDGATCSDNNPCTTGDACATGVCKGGAAATDGTKCDDSNGCTTGESCTSGVCGIAGAVCDDKSSCTIDVCVGNSFCQHNALPPGAACDDGNACTTGDVCDPTWNPSWGAPPCKTGTNATNCDDANACTADACDKVKGCTHTAVADASACSDGDLCTTGDACKGGACAATQTNCNDSNACTADSCNAATGACVHSAAADGSACLGIGTCNASACVVAGMQHISMSTFKMGCVAGDTSCLADEKFQHEVSFAASDLLVDTYEVTAGDYKTQVDAKKVFGVGLTGTSCNYGVAGQEKHPMNCVSNGLAQAYCVAVGKRLPTEAEFEYLLRGGYGDDEKWPSSFNMKSSGADAYPGTTIGNFADSKSFPTYPAWGAIPNYYDGYVETAPVGSLTGEFYFGIYDIHGNVAEWTADDYTASYGTLPVTDPVGVDTNSLVKKRVVRGGSYMDGAMTALRSSARRAINFASGTNSAPDVGFRCVLTNK